MHRLRKLLRPQNHQNLLQYLAFIFRLLSRQTETMHQQRVCLFESCSYWTCCWRVGSTSTACIRAGGGHFKHVHSSTWTHCCQWPNYGPRCI